MTKMWVPDHKTLKWRNKVTLTDIVNPNVISFISRILENFISIKAKHRVKHGSYGKLSSYSTESTFTKMFEIFIPEPMVYAAC